MRNTALTGDSPSADSGRAGLTPAPVLAQARLSSGPYGKNLPAPISGDETTDAEVHRIASLMLISFAGFLTAGWFLARAYTLSLFLYAGMVAAIYGVARKRGIAPPPLPIPRAAKLAALACAVAVALVWVSLRVNNR